MHDTQKGSLQKADKGRKELYLQDFLEHRYYFTPMVCSAAGIPVVEALAAQKRLSALLSFKMKQDYSELCGCVRARMALAIVRSNTLFLRIPWYKEACILQ